MGDIPRMPGREKVDGTCSPNGAGHFVKMVHNGIEYGLMAAYAVGLGVLRQANIGKQTAFDSALQLQGFLVRLKTLTTIDVRGAFLMEALGIGDLVLTCR